MIDSMKNFIKFLAPKPLRAAVAHRRLDGFARQPGAYDLGSPNIQRLIHQGRLAPDGKILDMGCGYGRIALPLTRFLTRRGSYVGVDILTGEITWAKKRISRRHPNFEFHLAQVYNKYYHVTTRAKASEYRFPCDDDSMDVVCLYSVFTHMLRQDAEHYISEIARVLKPGGRCIATFFFYTRHTAPQTVVRDFAYERDGCRISNEDRPEWQVAYAESDIRHLYAQNGLYVIEPVSYDVQDYIVAEKEMTACPQPARTFGAPNNEVSTDTTQAKHSRERERMTKRTKRGLIAGGILGVTALGCAAWANRRMFLVNDVTTGESASYPHLRSRVYYTDVGTALTTTEQAMRQMPRWRVVLVDTENDALEAEVETPVGHFLDDVTVYCVPLGHGQTQVIIHSRSRMGRGDLGQNAAHIRELQDAMDARLTGDAAF